MRLINFFFYRLFYSSPTVYLSATSSEILSEWRLSMYSSPTVYLSARSSEILSKWRLKHVLMQKKSIHGIKEGVGDQDNKDKEPHQNC